APRDLRPAFQPRAGAGGRERHPGAAGRSRGARRGHRPAAGRRRPCRTPGPGSVGRGPALLLGCPRPRPRVGVRGGPLRRLLQGRGLLLAVFLLTLPLVTPRLRGADEIEYFAYLRSLVFDADLEFGNEYQYFYERDPQGLAGFRETFLEKREPLTGRHI